MTIPEPTYGATVHDTRRDRVGVVMGRVGPCYQLRPLSGGREWDAAPEDIRPMTPAEVLHARLAEVNARSRKPTR
ncbi:MULTISPECIES: hypothetical protein [unclassified Streptomyces]|uniref:Uncharacterized protein n=1 Tax=Streptomyces millisiae TaxID=3075542 RepID=A0ABU2LU79_9ACTN|nr:hypothetical protein [Streptomyces sp. DSM 44918]MDT0321152.1 hypothetical protein [Streptomyces sp. DSM 44918]